MSKKEYSKLLLEKKIYYFPGMSWPEFKHFNEYHLQNLKRKNTQVYSLSEYRKKINV